MSEDRGLWFKHLCGEPFAHWHDHLGGGRYTGISRCGNKRQEPRDIARYAQQRAEGRIEVGQVAQCSRCLALVATDQKRWQEQARNAQRAAVMAWADDAATAEARHGAARDACLARIEPGSNRWDSGRREMDNRELAKAAWESGWDAAVAALKGGDS